eukprot:744899_1
MDPDTFDGTTSDSWYVGNQCLSLHELQPIWFIVLSQTITTITSYVMLVGSGQLFFTDDDDDTVGRAGNVQEDSSKKEKSPSGFSRYVKRPIKWMLKAWSIASIVTVTVLDIMEMSKWIQAHQGLSGWDHFVCMGCIIITSSNFKRLLGFTTVVLGVFRHLDKGDKISVGLLVILAGTVALYSLMVLPWIIVILMPAVFVSCWHVCLCVCCCGLLLSQLNDSCMEFLEKHPILSIILFAWIGIGSSSLFSSFALVTVNIYGGIEYWTSYVLVFEERKTSVYLDYILESTQSKYKFITWIF